MRSSSLSFSRPIFFPSLAEQAKRGDPVPRPTLEGFSTLSVKGICDGQPRMKSGMPLQYLPYWINISGFRCDVIFFYYFPPHLIKKARIPFRYVHRELRREAPRPRFDSRQGLRPGPRAEALNPGCGEYA